MAHGQHGCVTTAQLAAVGLGRRALVNRLADGTLRRIHRGVYVVGPVASPHAPAMAALLAVGDDAVLSHRTAAALWQLRPPAPCPVDVTTSARGTRRREDIRVHRTLTLPTSEVRRLDGLRVTAPERTLIDLALTDDDHLERALEEAQVRRLASRATLLAALDRHPRRPGTRVLRALLDANEPTLTRSEAERRLLALIAAAGLPRPRTNVRVGSFEVDLLWPAERLVVEVDGFAFHGSRAAFERDRARDAELMARGFRVIRITWRQIEREPHAVVARLAAALATAAA